MFLEDRGQGPAVVLLHGAPGTRESFHPLAAALESDHRVLIPDLPGYGQSPPLPRGTSIAAANALIEGTLIGHDVLKAAFVGLSLGAYRALAIALGGRIEVTGMLLLGGVAGLDPGEAEAFRGFAAAVQSGADIHDAWIARALSPGFAASHPRERAEVAAWVDAPDRAAFAAELSAIAAMEDLVPRLRKLRTPVVARVGELDLACPKAKSEAIVRAIPGARLEVVPGCGHALPVEDPEGTARAARALPV